MERNDYNPFQAILHDLELIKNSMAEIRNTLAVNTSPEKKYYTIEEAALKLNVARITIYRNAQSGKIPTKKIGSRVMIPGSFVDNR